MQPVFLRLLSVTLLLVVRTAHATEETPLRIGFLLNPRLSDTFFSLRSTRAPSWLRGLREADDEFGALVGHTFNTAGQPDADTIPFNVAVAYYMRAVLGVHVKVFHCVRLVPCGLFSKDAFDLHALVILSGPLEVFEYYGNEIPVRDQYIGLLRQLHAHGPAVFPSPMANFITYFKARYYALMNSEPHAVPVVPFLEWNVTDGVGWLAERVRERGWEGGELIVKPEFCSLSRYIFIINASKLAAGEEEEVTRVETLVKGLLRENYHSAAVQVMVPEFESQWELRTYWHNGEYSYTVRRPPRTAKRQLHSPPGCMWMPTI